MAKYCGKECKQLGGICDFCEYYDYNGDKDGCYIGKGYWGLHKKQIDPHYECNDFVCGFIKDKK